MKVQSLPETSGVEWKHPRVPAGDDTAGNEGEAGRLERKRKELETMLEEREHENE